MTTISVGFRKIKDPLGLAREAWFILENGRPTGYYGYRTEDEAKVQAKAVAAIRGSVARYVEVSGHA